MKTAAADRWSWTAAALGAVAAAVFCVGVWIDHFALRMLSKPWPVTLMIAVLALRTRHRYARLITAGLVACLCGDVLLEMGDATFLYGVGAFLVGHLLYTAAYVGRSRALRPVVAIPFLAWGVTTFVLLRPGLRESGMTVPVLVYTAAICAMMWRAAACWESPQPSATTLLAFAGAVLFAASDTLIAWNRFHEPIHGVRYVIILLYWLGQAGITASALRAGTGRREEGRWVQERRDED